VYIEYSRCRGKLRERAIIQKAGNNRRVTSRKKRKSETTRVREDIARDTESGRDILMGVAHTKRGFTATKYGMKAKRRRI
jgi:hypothetical protein